MKKFNPWQPDKPILLRPRTVIFIPYFDIEAVEKKIAQFPEGEEIKAIQSALNKRQYEALQFLAIAFTLKGFYGSTNLKQMLAIYGSATRGWQYPDSKQPYLGLAGGLEDSSEEVPFFDEDEDIIELEEDFTIDEADWEDFEW